MECRAAPIIHADVHRLVPATFEGDQLSIIPGFARETHCWTGQATPITPDHNALTKVPKQRRNFVHTSVIDASEKHTSASAVHSRGSTRSLPFYNVSRAVREKV